MLPRTHYYYYYLESSGRATYMETPHISEAAQGLGMGPSVGGRVVS